MQGSTRVLLSFLLPSTFFRPLFRDKQPRTLVDIVSHLPQESGVSVSTYNTVVAVRAEQTPDLTCYVIVVHSQPCLEISSVSVTYSAAALLVL